MAKEHHLPKNFDAIAASMIGDIEDHLTVTGMVHIDSTNKGKEKRPGELDSIAFPNDLDHRDNPHYRTHASDDLFEGEYTHSTPDTIKFIDLQTIIHRERDELLTQQKIFEVQHPEWIQQKAMVQEAGGYFDTHPEEDFVDVSIQTGKDGSVQSLSTARVEGYKFRTFARENIGEEIDNAYAFEIQNNYLKACEETTIDMIVGAPVIEQQKEDLETYLQQRQKRWNEKTAPNIKTTAERNANILSALSEKVKSYDSDPAGNGDLSEDNINELVTGLEKMLGFEKATNDNNKSSNHAHRPTHPPRRELGK